MSTDPNRPVAVLGMPGYGHQTSGAARGYWCATRGEKFYLTRDSREGSLLGQNFNALWCNALNMAHRGERVDYFAMQHADVEPEDWWLDKLIDELEERDLDVLGVVVPIKDTHGLTSLALDRPDGDTWRPLCRLTMHDVYRLPETFTSADIGHRLLLNTGLWVCKFNLGWAKQAHFTINDRVAFDTKLNQYVAETEPEDWYFSRLCHELGLKIGATRKIRLMHRGDMRFTNAHPWGDQAFDAAWIDASPVPHPKSDAFEMPAVSGWLRPEEGEKLAELAVGANVLEIGSYLGLSTVCLARPAVQVVSVDPHDGRGTEVRQDTHDAFVGNLKGHDVFDRVVSIVDTFETADVTGRLAPFGPFDLVFIDGAHDYGSVLDDIGRALRHLSPGGLIAFHDYRSDVDPGVTRAVDRLIRAGGELLSVTGSLAVVRPPAEIHSRMEV